MRLMPQLDVTFFGTGIIYLVVMLKTLLYLVDSYYVPQIGTVSKIDTVFEIGNASKILVLDESRNDYDHSAKKAEKIDAFKTFKTLKILCKN